MQRAGLAWCIRVRNCVRLHCIALHSRLQQFAGQGRQAKPCPGDPAQLTSGLRCHQPQQLAGGKGGQRAAAQADCSNDRLTVGQQQQGQQSADHVHCKLAGYLLPAARAAARGAAAAACAAARQTLRAAVQDELALPVLLAGLLRWLLLLLLEPRRAAAVAGRCILWAAWLQQDGQLPTRCIGGPQHKGGMGTAGCSMRCLALSQQQGADGSSSCGGAAARRARHHQFADTAVAAASDQVQRCGIGIGHRQPVGPVHAKEGRHPASHGRQPARPLADVRHG